MELPIKTKAWPVLSRWEWMSFTHSQFSLCEATVMELSERILEGEADVPLGIWEHNLHQCPLLATEVITGWNRHVEREELIVNCRSTFGMAKMPWVLVSLEGSASRFLAVSDWMDAGYRRIWRVNTCTVHIWGFKEPTQAFYYPCINRYNVTLFTHPLSSTLMKTDGKWMY